MRARSVFMSLAVIFFVVLGLSGTIAAKEQANPALSTGLENQTGMANNHL